MINMHAHIRSLVADIAVKFPTFTAARKSLPTAKNLSEELQRNVLVSLLADEYDDAAAIAYRRNHEWI